MIPYEKLLDLPGMPEEKDWLQKHLETLTVREYMTLSVAQLKQPAKTMMDAVEQICSLSDFTVCPAESYEELGTFYLEKETCLPGESYRFADLDKLGRWYEEAHPGVFWGSFYIAYPSNGPLYYYNGDALPEDDWSVKLKLSSPSVPDGEWLRLPDYEELDTIRQGEISITLKTLGVEDLRECTLLEARCILPGIVIEKERYRDMNDLVQMGQDLGFVLDEQGQGKPHFMERLLAALEYEKCHRLEDALDISRNPDCYDFHAPDGLEKIGVELLTKCGVQKEALESGAFDPKTLAHYYLLEDGFISTRDGSYICRNEKPFLREFSEAPPEMNMTM